MINLPEKYEVKERKNVKSIGKLVINVRNKYRRDAFSREA
jgi:hypothetical protein